MKQTLWVTSSLSCSWNGCSLIVQKSHENLTKWSFTHCYGIMVIPRYPSSLWCGAIPSISWSHREPSPFDNCSLGLPFLSGFYNLPSAVWDGQTSLTATPKHSEGSQNNAGFSSHFNLLLLPLPNPMEMKATLGRVYKSYTNTNWLLTLFSFIWWFCREFFAVNKPEWWLFL